MCAESSEISSSCNFTGCLQLESKSPFKGGGNQISSISIATPSFYEYQAEVFLGRNQY